MQKSSLDMFLVCFYLISRCFKSLIFNEEGCVTCLCVFRCAAFHVEMLPGCVISLNLSQTNWIVEFLIELEMRDAIAGRDAAAWLKVSDFVACY